MAYSRNEYLKQLNAMRNNYQNNGNAIINTIDDSTSVGEELSSFASMSTPLPSLAKENEIKEYKENRNGWQRTMDTMEEFGTNVKEGALNFLDSIGDFLIGAAGWVGSWFGADTQWAEDAIQYDWVSQASEVTNIFNPFDILSGDVFTADYYNEYANAFKSPEQARLRAAKRHSGSWVSDANPNFQQGYYNFTEGIGELLPSVALAFATGGTSLGTQMAIQGGVTAAKASGQSTERALQEGADFHGALKYGTTKGIIAGTITAATVGIGGSVLSKSGEGIISKGSQFIGEKIGSVFSNSATAEVIASKSAEILFRAGIDATSAGAQTLLDPVLKQITYDSEAIQNAYGSDEAIQNTLANLGNAMMQAGLTSAVLSAGKEVVSFAQAGSFEQYKENYFVNKIAGSDIKKAELYQKKYHEYLEHMNKELGIGTNNLKTETEAIQIINKYSNKILKLNERYNIDDLLNNLKKQPDLSGTSALKYEQAINNAKESETLKTTLYSSGTVSKSVLYQYLKESGWKAKSGGTYTSAKGDFLISATDSEGTAITLPNSPNSPIPLLENKQNDGVSLQLNSPNQAIAMLSTLNNSTKVYLPSTFVYENKTYSLTKKNLSYVKQEMENKNNDLYGLNNGESALKYLDNNYTPIEVSNLNSGNRILAIDQNGFSKYIASVLNDYNSAKNKAYIGKLRETTTDKLFNDTGLNLKGFSLAIDKSHIRHIVQRHIENSKTNLPLEYSDILKYPYIVSEYDSVNIKNENVLVFKKNIGSSFLVAAEFTIKGKTLSLKSLYKISGASKNKKGSDYPPTVHDESSLPPSTSETKVRASSNPNNIITKDIKKTQEKTSKIKAPSNLVKDSAHLRKEKVYSINSTSKIVKNVLTNIKNKLSAKKVEIKLKGSKSALIRKTFEELNLSKETDNVIDGLIQAITESTIYFNKGESSETYGKLGDYLDNNLIQDLRKCIKGLIDHTGQKAYVKRLTEKYLNIIDKMAEQIKEQRNLGHYAKVYTNLKNKLPKYLRKDLDFTENNETYHQLSLLLDPLKLASNSTNSYYDGGLKQKIADLLIKYKPVELDNNGEFKEGFSLFDENIRNEYQTLYDMLPDSTGENYSLNSAQLKQVVKLMRMISKVSKDSIETFKTKIGPNAFESINAIQKYGRMPALKHLEARWDVVRSMLGDSTLADEMTNGFRKAVGEAGLHSRVIKDKVSAYIKDNKLTKILHEKIDFYGSKISLGSLATTYAQLLTDADYEQIDLGGLIYTNSKGKRVAGLANKTKGKAAEIKQFLEDNLPVEVKEYAQFIKNILNNELKKDYGDYYKIKYGVSDANVMEDYMFLSRQIDKMASAESMINAPKLFGNEQNRVRKSSEPIKIVDLTDSFEQYVDNLYNHMYVMPLYRDLLKTLNTKVYVNGNRMNAITILKEKFGEKGYDIIHNTMNGIAGINGNRKTLLGRFFNGWYKATLGLKWTTIIKQNFSKFVSNYSISKITRAELKLIFGSKEFKTLLRDFETSIGEYINREKKSNTIHHYNSNNDFATKLDKVTDIFMLGISKMDKGTIRTGLAASIIAALDEGYSPNNDYFAELVVNDFTEFVLTQINSDVLGQNELGSTRFGDVFVFQGPARVALATINNKIRIWKRYHKLSSKDIDTAITQAEEEENEAQKLLDIAEDELNNAIEKLDKTKEESKNETLPKEERERRINEAKEVVKDKQNKLYEAEDKLREKKANTNSAKNDKKNFHRFKNMGGKKSILSMVTGLIMMGVGLTVVSELDQRIKGRKKWTEFDGQEILKQTAYNSTLSWIPVINTISNSVLNGYDVSLPSSTMINEVTDTLSSLYGLLIGDVSESNVKTLIRNAVNVLSNITGIPFKTIYDYIVGAISQFDPLTALRIKNVFYTMNSTAATKAYNEYVSENWESQAKAQLLYNSNYFKGGIIDDNIAEELYTFSKYGYNALPKDLMSSYTDIDGKVISLTKQQITQFASLYKESKKEVNNLLEISDYSSYNYYDQAKLVKKVYDTYYEYAKAKTTGMQSKNRITNILLLTNGKIGISKFLIGVNSLSTITESKTASRKELIMAQINKMTELTKSEKLLLVYLLGFSLSDKNKLVLSNYLRNNGANYKKAVEILQ